MRTNLTKTWLQYKAHYDVVSVPMLSLVQLSEISIKICAAMPTKKLQSARACINLSIKNNWRSIVMKLAQKLSFIIPFCSFIVCNWYTFIVQINTGSFNAITISLTSISNYIMHPL